MYSYSMRIVIELLNLFLLTYLTPSSLLSVLFNPHLLRINRHSADAPHLRDTSALSYFSGMRLRFIMGLSLDINQPRTHQEQTLFPRAIATDKPLYLLSPGVPPINYLGYYRSALAAFKGSVQQVIETKMTHEMRKCMIPVPLFSMLTRSLPYTFF